MTQTWKVIFENGVFRPLEPVDLPENQVGTVSVAVDRLIEDDESNSTKSAYDILLEMGAIGIYENSPTDLTTNPEHMEGFGKNASRDID